VQYNLCSSSHYAITLLTLYVHSLIYQPLCTEICLLLTNNLSIDHFNRLFFLCSEYIFQFCIRVLIFLSFLSVTYVLIFIEFCSRDSSTIMFELKKTYIIFVSLLFYLYFSIWISLFSYDN
jgi:hypothetical protein